MFVKYIVSNMCWLYLQLVVYCPTFLIVDLIKYIFLYFFIGVLIKFHKQLSIDLNYAFKP